MKWTFQNPVYSATSPETLLLEWEQRVRPIFSSTYRLARAGFMEQFQLLDRIMPPNESINIDPEDVRLILRQAYSLRIGSGRAGGSERAARAIHEAIRDTQQHLLGSSSTVPVTHALLCITSPTSAELEMEELTTISTYIQDVFGSEVEVIFGLNTETEAPAELLICLLLGYGEAR